MQRAPLAFESDPNPYMTIRCCRVSHVSYDQTKSLEAYWKIYHGATNYSWIAGLTINILRERLDSH